VVKPLRQVFLATPFRPTGLSTATRTVVRLVDELTWLDAIVIESSAQPDGLPVNRSACAVRSAAATVLERGADLLDRPASDPEPLRDALTELTAALSRMEHQATHELPVGRVAPSGAGVDMEMQIGEFISSLDPSFRAQELAFAVSLVAGNIDRAAAAERRSWVDRLLGRQPEGLPGSLSAAQERAAAHVEWHSVWLHNSLRGGAGLGLAVLVADLAEVQHSFWVVLGALSVLRSNALSTGQNALRGLLGTVAGFALGALLLVPIGTDTRVLWVLLPVAILVAGVGPRRDRLRHGAGRIHRRACDPVQHPRAGRLAGRAAARGGRRDRLRGEPGRRVAVLAARCGGGTEPGAVCRLHRQRRVPGPRGRVRHGPLRRVGRLAATTKS
jgi:hypothetical protein